MIDGIPAWVGLSPTTATALAMFYLVFSGRLIPGRPTTPSSKVLQERNAEVALDVSNWQSAADLANQTNAGPGYRPTPSS